MKVYYDSSLWRKGKGHCGKPQSTNWQFEYAAVKRMIPTIYRFAKGIVFDVVTVLDEAELRAYFDKYEAVAEELTSSQQRCAEQEHPFQSIQVREIRINGQRVEGGFSSSSSVSIPWARQDDALNKVQKAYASVLGNMACFACERFCVPYPKTHFAAERLKRFLRLNRVKNIKLSAHSVQRFYPLDIKFDMTDEDKCKEVPFNHPVTGETHKLYVQNAEMIKVPLGGDADQSLYAINAMYEIEPALPKEDHLQFNSSVQNSNPVDVSGIKDTSQASAIGIIGGADGPTAIFTADRCEQNSISCGLHGLPLHSCISVPMFSKEAAAHFTLEGINVKTGDRKEWLLR